MDDGAPRPARPARPPARAPRPPARRATNKQPNCNSNTTPQHTPRTHVSCSVQSSNYNFKDTNLTISHTHTHFSCQDTERELYLTLPLRHTRTGAATSL